NRYGKPEPVPESDLVPLVIFGVIEVNDVVPVLPARSLLDAPLQNSAGDACRRRRVRTGGGQGRCWGRRLLRSERRNENCKREGERRGFRPCDGPNAGRRSLLAGLSSTGDPRRPAHHRRRHVHDRGTSSVPDGGPAGLPHLPTSEPQLGASVPKAGSLDDQSPLPGCRDLISRVEGSIPRSSQSPTPPAR